MAHDDKLRNVGVKPYLTVYNGTCAIAWLSSLFWTCATVLNDGPSQVYQSVGQSIRWTQTLAILEIIHSLLGIVRAPWLTTTMQVASRLLLVWLILPLNQPSTYESAFLTSMYLAWGITEIIRYSYFVCNLQSGVVPATLQWLRYNTFYVLYPIGISSECSLIWKASMHDRTPQALRLAFWIILAIYVPGSYVLFTHMMKQRRRLP